MSSVIRNNYPFLNRTDVVVIAMHFYEPNAYCLFNAQREGVTVRIDAFNVVDDQNGTNAAPDIADTPIATTTVSLVGGAQSKFVLRGGGGHPLAPATFQNRVTMLTITAGTMELDVASPSRFDTNIRQPASTPINT
jgi:hypothetical protein